MLYVSGVNYNKHNSWGIMGRLILQFGAPIVAWLICDDLLSRGEGQPSVIFLVAALMIAATIPLLLSVLRARPSRSTPSEGSSRAPGRQERARENAELPEHRPFPRSKSAGNLPLPPSVQARVQPQPD